MAYDRKVIEHYENPQNVGSLDRDNPHVGTGIVGSPSCGDVLKLQILVNPDTGIIEEVVFKTFGCGSAIASSSLVTETLKGRHIKQALELRNKDIAADLKLPKIKFHCSVLAEDAIKCAVDDYNEKAPLRMKLNALVLTSEAPLKEADNRR